MDNGIRPKHKVFGIVPIKKVLIFLVIIFGASFIIIEGFIIYAGSKTDNTTTDYVIILGAGLRGEVPSLALVNRMEKGLEYAKTHPKVKLVLSGGQGIDETITEAEAMRRFFIKNDIAQDRLIIEDKSTSTYENFKNTSKLLKKLGAKFPISIMIETNNFHMLRAKFIAKGQGFIAYGEPSEIPYFLIPNLYVREYFGVIKSFIFDRR